MERSKMSYCTTLHVSWKWNFGVHVRRGILRTAHVQQAFLIFDRGRESCHFSQF